MSHESWSDITGEDGRHVASDIFLQPAARLLMMVILAVRTSSVPGVSDKALHEISYVDTNPLDTEIEKRIRVSENHHSGKTRQIPYSLSYTIHLHTTHLTPLAVMPFWVTVNVPLISRQVLRILK
jgi:hypothetical protein